MTSLPRTPSQSLDGRRALVTGGAGGIGVAACAALAQAGASVTVCDRAAEAAHETVAALRAAGHDADACVLDITDVEAVRTTLSARPAYHVLVNNAGMNRPATFPEVRVEDFDAVLGLNVRAAFFVAQAVVRRMLADGVRGSLIHTSSQMGHVAMPTRACYATSKWAVEGMSKALALDLAPHGIRSNTIAPTFVETALTRPMFANETFRQSVLAQIRLGRLAKVEDLMGALLFLASDASAMVTGTSLVVDGGWTAA